MAVKLYFCLRPDSEAVAEGLGRHICRAGVRNSSGVGTGVGAKNLTGVDSGVDFYCLNFALALASNTLEHI